MIFAAALPLPLVFTRMMTATHALTMMIAPTMIYAKMGAVRGRTIAATNMAPATVMMIIAPAPGITPEIIAMNAPMVIRDIRIVSPAPASGGSIRSIRLRTVTTS